MTYTRLFHLSWKLTHRPLKMHFGEEEAINTLKNRRQGTTNFSVRALKMPPRSISSPPSQLPPRDPGMSFFSPRLMWLRHWELSARDLTHTAFYCRAPDRYRNVFPSNASKICSRCAVGTPEWISGVTSALERIHDGMHSGWGNIDPKERFETCVSGLQTRLAPRSLYRNWLPFAAGLQRKWLIVSAPLVY